MSSYEIINIGTLPNDGEGDPLRVAFRKINNNFANLYSTVSTNNSTTTGSGSQVIFQVPTSVFTQGMFMVRSSNPSTMDSQEITLTAQITNDMLDVKFTGYGTTFSGVPITRYDMDVYNANVRIIVNPLSSVDLAHFVSSFITYEFVGMGIQLDGYALGNLLVTEDDMIIITEQS